MPSDDRVPGLLRALRSDIDVYESAIRAAIDRVDSLLAWTAKDNGTKAGVVELGQFAADRIDLERFASLHEERWALDRGERAILTEARRVLQEYTSIEPSRFMVDVSRGGRIGNAVRHAFAELGRPFGAVLVAELLRRGRYAPAEHGSLLHGFPRHEWHRTERAASPPLVVTVDGADLWAGELVSFIDGNQRIALVVRSPAPPATLVRLITPGMLVFQTSSDETAAALLAKHAGAPAVGAVVPEGCAEFVHEPDPARPLAQRLSVTVTPHGARRGVASWTQWQQEQELLQLVTLATNPGTTSPASTGKGDAMVAEPADRLAAWLLTQSDALVSRG